MVRPDMAKWGQTLSDSRLRGNWALHCSRSLATAPTSIPLRVPACAGMDARGSGTQNHCHATMRQLFDACIAFINRINADPKRLTSCLRPKFKLDPDFEKLLTSN